MSVKFKNIPMAMIEKIDNTADPKYTLGFNDCRSQQGEVEITMHRQRLAKEIWILDNDNNIPWDEQSIRSRQKYFIKADAIIARLGELLEGVKK